MYNNVIINGETAIKPYYYMRNGILHARYTVDRAVELSEREVYELKDKISLDPYNKQEVLARYWNLQTNCIGKTVIYDGVKAGEERMKELTEQVKNGQ